MFYFSRAASPELDLREFDSGQHAYIFCYEAMPHMFCDERKLLQGPLCWFDLSGSAANCHQHQVCVSGVQMIVCTDAWCAGVASLPRESDRAWLRDHSMLVDVTEPMGARGVSRVAV